METFEEAKLAALAWLAQKEEKEAREAAEAEARAQQIREMKIEKAKGNLARYLPKWAMSEAKIEIPVGSDADDFSFVLEFEGVAPINGEYEWNVLEFMVPGVIPGYVSGYGKTMEHSEPEWSWSNKYRMETTDLQIALAMAIRAEEEMVKARVDYQERLAAAQSEPSYTPVYEDVFDGTALFERSDAYLAALIRKIVAEELGK